MTIITGSIHIFKWMHKIIKYIYTINRTAMTKRNSGKSRYADFVVLFLLTKYYCVLESGRMREPTHLLTRPTWNTSRVEPLLVKVKILYTLFPEAPFSHMSMNTDISGSLIKVTCVVHHPRDVCGSSYVLDTPVLAPTFLLIQLDELH